MKNLIKLISFLIIMSFGIMANAQSTKSHIVDRGETLESIAQKYNVSTEQILQLNPDAKQFIYVGMKLEIPVAQLQQLSQSNIETEVVPVNNTSSSNNSDSRAKRFFFADEVGYGFLQKGEGSSAFALHFSIGADYFINNNLYAGAKVGYSIASYIATKSETSYHFISVPLEIGYALSTKNNKLSLAPYGGLNFNICVAGKSEYDGEKQDIKGVKGKLCMDAIFGVRVNIYSFFIGGAYHFPINKEQKGMFGKDSYPTISIGYAFF